MPESFVQVAPNSSGVKLHTFQRTIGANTVDEQLVQLGMPYLAAYKIVTPAAGTSAATAASHLLQIMAGGTLNVYVMAIEVYQLAVATAAAIDALEIVRLTTAGTGGTAVGAAPLDTTDAAAGATGMTLPTAKGTEGTFVDRATVQWTQTIGTASGGKETPQLALMDYERLKTKAIRIPAGTANGIAIKNPTARAGATVIIIADIIEANF